MEMSFQGIKQKEYDALTGVTKKWSDGATVELTAAVTGAKYKNSTNTGNDTQKNWTANLGYQFAFGNGLTSTEAASGGWIVSQSWTANNCAANGNTCTTTNYLEGYYMAVKTVDKDNAVKISSNSNYSDITEKGEGGGDWQFATTKA